MKRPDNISSAAMFCNWRGRGRMAFFFVAVISTRGVLLLQNVAADRLIYSEQKRSYRKLRVGISVFLIILHQPANSFGIKDNSCCCFVCAACSRKQEQIFFTASCCSKVSVLLIWLMDN